MEHRPYAKWPGSPCGWPGAYVAEATLRNLSVADFVNGVIETHRCLRIEARWGLGIAD